MRISNVNRRSRTLGEFTARLVAIVIFAAAASATAAPRIAPVPQEAWSDAQRLIAESLPDGMSNAVATYLHHPVLAANLIPFESYITGQSSLAPRDRMLLILRTAWLCRSDYVWAQHAATARRAGLSDRELNRIAAGPQAPGWDAREAAVLLAADELHVDSFISDATWSELATHFTNEQLVDLVFTAAEFTMISGTVNSLRVDFEPDRRERLPYGIPRTSTAQWTNERLIGREPRLEPLPREKWTEPMRRILDPEDSGRAVANVYGTYIYSPEMDLLRRRVSEHIRDETTLSDRHREVLLMRIGVLCRSEYEWAAHSRIGRRLGMTDGDLERIIAGPSAPNEDPVEHALLRATDELYRDDYVSDETWAMLAGEFDTQQLLDILTAIGGYRMFSMAINTFGVQLDANMAEARFPEHLR